MLHEPRPERKQAKRQPTSSEAERAPETRLTPEQRTLLEPMVERDSQAFFDFIQAKINSSIHELMSAFAKHQSDLKAADVEQLLVASGIDATDAAEAARMVAFAAKQATSATDFHELLNEQFNPKRRLELTMQHFRDDSDHSWYNTPDGQARVRQLLTHLETTN